MIITVTGGRDFDDYALLDDVLTELNPSRLILGDARGADTLAKEWADHKKTISYEIHKAQWDKFGKSAGPIRNKEMLRSAAGCGIVLAFPGGAGTENCIKQAKDLNMIVLRVER